MGLVGLLGSLLIGALAVLNLLQVRDAVHERADVLHAKDAAAGLQLRNMDISGCSSVSSRTGNASDPRP